MAKIHNEQMPDGSRIIRYLFEGGVIVIGTVVPAKDGWWEAYYPVRETFLCRKKTFKAAQAALVERWYDA